MRKLMLMMVMAVLAGLALEAHAATPTFTDTVTPTSTPTYTITETSTVTPMSSPTYTITETSTITPTHTPSPTISPTFTITTTCTEVVNVLVSVNHNYFYPLRGETLEINNLNTLHAEVTIRIYSQSGALVKTLMDKQTVSRGLVPVWDGRNEQGERVASGVYVVVVQGLKLHKRFRVALIK